MARHRTPATPKAVRNDVSDQRQPRRIARFVDLLNCGVGNELSRPTFFGVVHSLPVAFETTKAAINGSHLHLRGHHPFFQRPMFDGADG